MPDPIQSSCVPPDLTCTDDAAPPLSCEPAVAPAPSATPNACVAPEPSVSSAASALAQKFFQNDATSFIAAASSPAASPGARVPAPVTAPPHSAARPLAQVNLQLGHPRIEGHTAVSGLHLAGGIDILNANAHLGEKNEDGSQGANVGIGATLLGLEGSAEYKGCSLTLGVSGSWGGSIASGEGRDIDGDGVPERCFKMSLGPFTLGECDEL